MFFSERRTKGLNGFFTFITKIGEHISYVLALILLLFVRFRKALMIPILGLLVGILSLGLKGAFLQARPFDYFNKHGTWNQIETVEGIVLLTGPSSFPSGHTMSAFALFSFLALSLNKGRILNFGLGIVALLIGISRIYLVQHFLVDVLAGAFCGLLIGGFCYGLQALLVKPFNGVLNNRILRSKSKEMQV